MSDTPLTDAVTHLIRQRNDRTYETMLQHARRMERDRARLMECLRVFDRNYQDGYICGHAAIIKDARALLRELESK